MMTKRILTALIGSFLLATQAIAQPRTVTGKVTRDANVPLSGVSVIVKGSTQITQTNTNGDYSIRAESGQVLVYRLIGYLLQERTVGAANTISVQLEKAAAGLDAMVVTALGQTTVQRSLAPTSFTCI